MRKKFLGLLFIILVIVCNIVIGRYINVNGKASVLIKLDVIGNQDDTYQLLYSQGEFEGDQIKAIDVQYQKSNEWKTLVYEVPKDTQYIRFDLGNQPAQIKFNNVSLNYYWYKQELKEQIVEKSIEVKDIDQISSVEEGIAIKSIGTDPYILIKLDEIKDKYIISVDQQITLIAKVLLCIISTIVLFIVYKKLSTICRIVKEVWDSKKLIWDLSKNDFKTKYAGSYLGITWAFVQPIITVLVYWFVFEVGFKSAPVKDFPFVLWLVSGMVPWFFFNDALINATNSLIEYSYLVKKVVFKISILPIVKIISALFVHIFFILFLIGMFTIYGYYTNIYFIQLIYYSFCVFFLTLGIAYVSSALIVFFKDLGQIISIVLQVGMWMTPILWDYHIMPERYLWLLKLNPMYYVVEGYRDTFINKVWFWERYNQTIYFWIISFGFFILGNLIFKKLKNHFADVL